MKVMILDDEPLIVEGLCACLEQEGHEVRYAYTGQAAIKLALEYKPDIMLIDYRLPDINGVDVVREIEQSYMCPTVFLTAYSDQAILEMANDLTAAYGFLVKPVDERTLLATMSIAIARFERQARTEEKLVKAEVSLKKRKLIERAKGILMEQMNISEPKAMEALQRQSKNCNRKLADTARRIIEFYQNQ